jgi:hypothetical protein
LCWYSEVSTGQGISPKITRYLGKHPQNLFAGPVLGRKSLKHISLQERQFVGQQPTRLGRLLLAGLDCGTLYKLNVTGLISGLLAAWGVLCPKNRALSFFLFFLSFFLSSVLSPTSSTFSL